MLTSAVHHTDFLQSLQPCSLSCCVTGFAHVSNKKKRKHIVSTKNTTNGFSPPNPFHWSCSVKTTAGEIKTLLQWLIHAPAGTPCSGKVPAQEVCLSYKWMLKGNGESQMSALECGLFFFSLFPACMFTVSSAQMCFSAHCRPTAKPAGGGQGAERVQGHLSSGSGHDWHLRRTNSLQKHLRRQKKRSLFK